jgi:hypothetical protein
MDRVANPRGRLAFEVGREQRLLSDVHQGPDERTTPGTNAPVDRRLSVVGE